MQSLQNVLVTKFMIICDRVIMFDFIKFTSCTIKKGLM